MVVLPPLSSVSPIGCQTDVSTGSGVLDRYVIRERCQKAYLHPFVLEIVASQIVLQIE